MGRNIVYIGGRAQHLLAKYNYVKPLNGYVIDWHSMNCGLIEIMLPGWNEQGTMEKPFLAHRERNTSACEEFSGEAECLHWIIQHVVPEQRFRLKFSGLHLRADEKRPDLVDIQNELNCEP